MEGTVASDPRLTDSEDRSIAHDVVVWVMRNVLPRGEPCKQRLIFDADLPYFVVVFEALGKELSLSRHLSALVGEFSKIRDLEVRVPEAGTSSVLGLAVEIFKEDRSDDSLPRYTPTSHRRELLASTANEHSKDLPKSGTWEEDLGGAISVVAAFMNNLSETRLYVNLNATTSRSDGKPDGSYEIEYTHSLTRARYSAFETLSDPRIEDVLFQVPTLVTRFVVFVIGVKGSSHSFHKRKARPSASPSSSSAAASSSEADSLPVQQGKKRRVDR